MNNIINQLCSVIFKWEDGSTYCLGTLGDKVVTKEMIDSVPNVKTVSYLSIQDSVREIGESAFASCKLLRKINNLGANVKTIGDKAFYGLEILESAYINCDAVETIGREAFKNCKRLSDFGLGCPSLINDEAFANCFRLNQITVNECVGEFGDKVFASCVMLDRITFKSKTPPKIGKGLFYNSRDDLKICVPKESVKMYRSAANWSEWSSKIVGR